MIAPRQCQTEIDRFRVPLEDRQLARLFYRRGYTHGQIKAIEDHLGHIRQYLDRLEIEAKRMRRAMERL